ncbi:MAG: amidase family protein, partial [Clostridia bacterium]
PSTDYALSAYYIISSAEAASNLARYDGIGYGYRALDVQSVDELIERSREDSFGREVKRRISFGSFALSATQYDDVYEKACKARLLVTRELDKLFEKADILLAPTCISKPQRRGEPLKYEADYYTVLANLTGAAAITVCGVQLIAKRGNDELLIETARILEARLGGDNNDV